jgi:hypothetical protein
MRGRQFLALPVLAFAVAVVALCASGLPQARADGTSPAKPAAKDCIVSWPEARMQAYGYNHIVHVKDVCDAPADCVITTDVNPEPTKLAVPAKSEAEINTFLGSPARVFTPKVVCTMRVK